MVCHSMNLLHITIQSYTRKHVLEYLGLNSNKKRWKSVTKKIYYTLKTQVYNSKNFLNLCAIVKLYGVYSSYENRNKKIGQTENAKDISSIIYMDIFLPISTFLLYSKTTNMAEKTD